MSFRLTMVKVETSDLLLEARRILWKLYSLFPKAFRLEKCIASATVLGTSTETLLGLQWSTSRRQLCHQDRELLSLRQPLLPLLPFIYIRLPRLEVVRLQPLRSGEIKEVTHWSLPYLPHFPTQPRSTRL